MHFSTLDFRFQILEEFKMTVEVLPGNRYRLGFTSLNSEVTLDQLPIEGQIPGWLKGSLYRNGPAKFEVGHEKYSHYFDGLAMLHRYSFEAGQVAYRNRFLRTPVYQKAVSTGKINGGFGTNQNAFLLLRVLNMAQMVLTQSYNEGYNTNVSIARFGENFVALTEPPTPTAFDPQTLKTLGLFDFKDELRGQLSTPHPHYDYQNRQQINYLTRFGRTNAYQVYRLAEGSRRRRLIGTIPVREAAYMHSFATTENYIILTEYPFVLNPLDLVLSSKPYIENYRWKPQNGTKFYVMSKKTGRVEKIFQSAAFFGFHHVNAYEQGNDIFVDVAALPDAASIGQGYLADLRAANKEYTLPRGQFRRYHMVIRAGVKSRSSLDYEVMSEEGYDMPALNLAQNSARDYRYAYGVGYNRHLLETPSNQLLKIDLKNRTTKIWAGPSCYPGEPIFVANPEAKSEDDGVILSVALDGLREKSFLLVLDASSFEEIGRANLPHHVPFDFHGLYAEK